MNCRTVAPPPFETRSGSCCTVFRIVGLAKPAVDPPRTQALCPQCAFSAMCRDDRVTSSTHPEGPAGRDRPGPGTRPRLRRSARRRPRRRCLPANAPARSGASARPAGPRAASVSRPRPGATPVRRAASGARRASGASLASTEAVAVSTCASELAAQTRATTVAGPSILIWGSRHVPSCRPGWHGSPSPTTKPSIT